MRLRWLVGAALVACSSAGEVDLEGRVCAAGEVQCLEGYICHPEHQTCVCAIEIGCDGDSSCAQLTQTGDGCPCAGAFIKCDAAADTCEHGCRDCQPDGTWGTCSEQPCDEAAPELCDGRDNDCDGLIDEGIHGCDCAGGASGTPEQCDHRDNDCNTAIDDGFPCRFDSVRPCEGGLGLESCDRATCRWSGICVPRDNMAPAPVTLFVAQPENARIQLSWLHPADADLDLCVVRRRDLYHPDHHLTGDLVHVVIGPVPGSAASITDEGLTNGEPYTYAVFCRDTAGTWNDSLQIGVNAGGATPTAGAAVNPNDFQASDGEDTQSTISFTMPPSAIECRLRRRRNDSSEDYPETHEEVESDLLFTFTSDAQLPWVNQGLENGGSYYYAVFCSNGEGWNDGVAVGLNADVAHPRDPEPDNPLNFVASDDEDSLSTLTFTMPATEECRVVRRGDGAYPGTEDDGDPVGTFSIPGLVRVVDIGLTNGTMYHYAVFCREGTTWNRNRDTGNADTATPLDIAIVHEDLVARGTRDSNTVVSDPVTFVDNRLYLAVVTTRPYLPANAGGVTGLGFTWALAATQCGANDETGTEIWWAFGTPTGSNQVRANLPAQANGAYLAVLRYGGVNSAQPVGATATTNSGGGSCADASGLTGWTTSITATSDSVVFGSVAILGAEHSPGSGVTEIDEFSANSGSNEVAMALVSRDGNGASLSLSGLLTIAEKWAVVLVELLP